MSSPAESAPTSPARPGRPARRGPSGAARASGAVLAPAGALGIRAVGQARRSRIQCIADTWGGGPAERLLARGVIGMLEAGASEWVEHQACSLAEAADLLTRTLWNGLGRFPRVDTGG